MLSSRARQTGKLASRRSGGWLAGWFGGGGNRRTVAVVSPKRRLQRKAQIERLRRWLVRALLVCGVLGAALATVWGGWTVLRQSPRLALRHLEIVGTHRLTVASVRRRAEVAEGQNLLRLDLPAIDARLRAEPWIASLRLERQLPSTLRIVIQEHQPAALVALQGVYLSDAKGQVFKRATAKEYGDLPVITGIERTEYLTDRAQAQARIAAALAAHAAFVAGSTLGHRPAIGEISVDPLSRVTLFTHSGLSVSLGAVTQAELAQRLRRFDRVWQALVADGKTDTVRVIFLQSRAHPDQVTVRYAQNSEPHSDG